MSSTDSAIARKVDDILRNQWTIYFGFSGRHAPDLVDDLLRIMHISLPHLEAIGFQHWFYHINQIQDRGHSPFNVDLL